jgi:hypothetical protein
MVCTLCLALSRALLSYFLICHRCNLLMQSIRCTGQTASGLVFTETSSMYSDLWL